ncbi:MAG: type VI secretion system-associated FHA domain protein TagH, partial [Steroidobacteraceae bacterium]
PVPGAAPGPAASAAPRASSRPASPSAAPDPAAASAPAGQAIPDDWNKTNFSRKPVAPAPKPAAPVSRRPLPPSPTPAPAQQRPSASGFDIDALLKSAGVDPAGIPPETAGSLGLILRSVVQGVIDVLRARSEIKEQFRLSQTIVKTAENNPLKFAVNAEDALNSLLGRRNPAYLPPVEAFDDALNDIRFHQLAMLAGMRAGFDHVMSRFDPQQLQESFDKRSKRGGLLSMSGKSRYWEQFAEEFQELAGDKEQAFRRLFAEEFAAAYEKQLELLKRSHGKVQR